MNVVSGIRDLAFACALACPFPNHDTGVAAEVASAGPPLLQDPAARRRIEEALPTRAPAPPRRPRRLLIFDRNVGYGGHGSIPHASHAMVRMGEVTGAFAAVVSRDPAVFEPVTLGTFDAVFFNNNVGNLFTEPALRRSLVEFVYAGGGLLGVHGASVAFTVWPGATEDWPEFGLMIGARGANHRDSDEHVVIKLDDPTHPLTQPFAGHGFDYRDEFFRVHEPYSRNRLRVLLSIDTEKTDLNQGPARGTCLRADNDYALAWIRNYGRGRTFYCTIAHNPYVFWDPRMLEFYLAAIQFALGDLPAPATPSAKLTPPIRAQEKLGWRLGLTVSPRPQTTLFESIDQASSLGLLYLSSATTQPVSADIPKPFNPNLTDEDRQAIRLKLDAAAVRLLAYAIPRLPTDPAECRNLFEFGRKMGIETFLCDTPISSLDPIDALCREHQINLALRGSEPGSPKEPTPAEILKTFGRHGKHIGAWASLQAWLKAGIDPVDAVQTLQHRLLCLQIQDQPGQNADPSNAAQSPLEQPAQRVLEELHRLQLAPALFAIESATLTPGTNAALTRSIELFNQTSLSLVPNL